MERKALITEYFQKASALVLSAAGIDSIEKQALYLIAAETEKYAQSLGVHASRMAEAARRSQCTADDIDAAAKCLNDLMGITVGKSSLSVSPESKKRLRTSVENRVVHDIAAPAEVDTSGYNLPQRDMSDSPLKSMQKRIQSFPEWLQKDLEKDLVNVKKEAGESAEVERKNLMDTSETSPLSLVSSLVLAEEESRNILTSKLVVGVNSIGRTHN
jgi:histone H3/H4